jgi:hypothetical protein
MCVVFKGLETESYILVSPNSGIRRLSVIAHKALGPQTQACSALYVVCGFAQSFALLTPFCLHAVLALQQHTYPGSERFGSFLLLSDLELSVTTYHKERMADSLNTDRRAPN